MVIKLFLPVCLLALSLCSCTQEYDVTIPFQDPDHPAPAPIDLVRTTVTMEGTTTNSYDHQDRIIKTEYNDGSSIRYEYSADHVTGFAYSSAGSLYRVDTYYYNDKGLAERITSSTSPGREEWRTYNDKKQIVHYSYSDTGFSGDYYYSNDNVDSVVYKKNNVWLYTYIYTYFPNIPNTLDRPNYGKPFLGKESKNPIDTWKSRSPASLNTIGSNTYAVDEKGRIKTRYQAVHDSLEVFEFTYE